MPQVDLENSVSVPGGGSDRKIACETLADGDPPPGEPDLADVPPDYPPESFWLSKDAEFDWFDRNAVLERKESTKGNSNSNPTNPNPNLNLNSSSRRFSKSSKSKASMIGLPNTQKINHVDANRRSCKPASIRMFPKRSGSAGKTAGQMTEPSSPKVSCMGRVRSKRGRRRSSETTTTAAAKKKAEKAKAGGGRRRTGFFGGFASIFRSGRLKKPAAERDEPPPENSPPRNSVRMKVREISVGVEPVAEPPGLGGMVRFSSGRRSTESWGVDDGGPTGGGRS